MSAAIMMISAALFCLTLLDGSPATADELTAGELYAFCNAKDEVSNTACRFYILGVVQGIHLADGNILNARGTAERRRRTFFCMPDGLSDDDMLTTFRYWVQQLARSFPQDMQLPAIAVISVAMGRAYPCPK